MRSWGDLLAEFGWICLGFCVVLVLIWYVSGLKAHENSGRIGVVVNPEEPQAQWRFAPAADQEVLIIWKGHRALVSQRTAGFCAGTRIVRTDRDGRFASYGWWASPGWPPPRVGLSHATPIVAGVVPLDLLDPPEDYSVILGPPPADSALALMFVDQLSAARLAEQAGCPPPREH